MERATAGAPIGSVEPRIAAQAWERVETTLDTAGWAVLERVLTPQECGALAALYDSEAYFRSRVVMARHGFGSGEYKYFAYPLPPLVAQLRHALYPRLAPLANRWSAAMGMDVRYPGHLDEFVERCRRAGQDRPTPLLLRYAEGDYNRLHQDLYGEHAFPLQVAFLLSRPGLDFEGGEFVLVEQRPRMQSRAMVVPLQQGDGVVFPVRCRPAAGTRGAYRVSLRHGVSAVRRGRRHALGVIFHDAR